MSKHVAYLLWICIFYFSFFWHAEACGIPSLGMHLLFFSFCTAPYPWCIFERERCHTWTWSFILWMDGILLTSSVEELHVVEICTWSWSWEYEMNLTKGHNNLTKLNEITSCICGVRGGEVTSPTPWSHPRWTTPPASSWCRWATPSCKITKQWQSAWLQ